MKMQKNWLLGSVVGAGALTLGLSWPSVTSRVAYAVDSGRASAASDRLSAVTDLSHAFEDVAEAIKPSVVNISAIKKVKARHSVRRLPDGFSHGPFREFFGDEFFDRFFHPQQQPRGYVQQGLGTGVIVSDDGHILTNNHVVDNADEVTVKLSDERTFTARVIGTDPKTDLAVIKVAADDLHPATLGDSDTVRIGQWVVAVGNPFGLSNTLTAGIVSAKGRSNVGIVDYEDFIQTDAAINPGNSGGPLVNLRGEVVGINTAIFTKSGGYMGVGFSIPVNMARSVLESLIENGHVVRGYLGVLIQDLDEGLAQSFGFDGKDGALVGDVTPGGPAADAGLVAGDIIVGFDGRTVENVARLRSMVAETKPGTRAQLEVWRDGQTERLYAEIGELEAHMAAAPGQSKAEDLGLSARTLTPDIAARLGLDDGTGVIVTDVDPFGPAARAGIQEHDVITRVQGQEVRNITEFRDLIAKNDLTKGIRLRVRTGNSERFALLRSNS